MCAGTHYNMLPINQPRCPFHFGQEDGAQNWMHRDEEVSSENTWAVWLINCYWQQLKVIYRIICWPATACRSSCTSRLEASMQLGHEAAAISIVLCQCCLLRLPFTKCALTWVPLLPL